MSGANPLLGVRFLADDLARVETALRAAVVADDAYLTQVAGHLIGAGGKRGRPAFALAAAATRSGEAPPATDDVVMGAVAVELVHLGSLYHDDVMDEATSRRGVESVNARWGNLQAILAGDYLLARASEIASSLGTEVAGLLARTISRLCEGQILELQHTYDVGRTEESYRAAIEGKTAALYSTACRIGALTASLPAAQVDALTEFGRQFGMAFQIVDDVLDVVATDEQLGKPAGHDLIEGVYTLPVIRLLAAGGEDADRLADLLGGPLTDEQMREARALVRGNGSVPSALRTAREYVGAARDALGPWASRESAAALDAAAEHLLTSVEPVAARA